MDNDKYKPIPINEAEYISKKYTKSQVIIVTWDKKFGKTHVTTYGRSKKDCIEAAQGGNMVKKALGWPDTLCHAKPDLTKKGNV